MKDTIEAGGVDTPLVIDPRPNIYIESLRGYYQPVDFPSEDELSFLLQRICEERKK